MPELTLDAAGLPAEPARPPLARTIYAQQVHAEAHAIIALQSIYKDLDGCDHIGWVRQRIDAEITARCRRLGLDPDLLGDALEAATEDLALRGLRRVVAEQLEGIRHA